MIINRVTITGADHQTPLKDLTEMSEKHPLIEWGVLFSPSQQGKPRYPTEEWIAEFLSELADNVSCSAHLCGRSINFLSKGDKSVLNVVRRFDRVQLNFNFHKLGRDKLRDIKEVAEQEGLVIITQHNDVNKQVWRFLKNFNTSDHHILFDCSGGQGIVPLYYLEPFPKHFCGYAGGLGPENLEKQLKKLSETIEPNTEIWIDMESRVRTDEKLDLAKVEACLNLVENQCWLK